MSWTKARRQKHSERMKIVWNKKQERRPSGAFQTTRRRLVADTISRDGRFAQTTDQLIHMALHVLGREVFINVLRRMIHEFVDGKDFKVKEADYEQF